MQARARGEHLYAAPPPPHTPCREGGYGPPLPPGPSCGHPSGAAGRVQPSPLPMVSLSPPPPALTVAFCFLSDTRIRWCVRVTNLLQAGQLSQGGLTRRVGKADTLGEHWQAGALAAVGSWAFSFLFPGAEQTPCQADLGSGPSPVTGQLCDLGACYCTSSSLSFLVSVMEPLVLPASWGGGGDQRSWHMRVLSPGVGVKGPLLLYYGSLPAPVPPECQLLVQEGSPCSPCISGAGFVLLRWRRVPALAPHRPAMHLSRLPPCTSSGTEHDVCSVGCCGL